MHVFFCFLIVCVCVLFFWFDIQSLSEGKSECSLTPPDVAQFADWRGKAGSLVCGQKLGWYPNMVPFKEYKA